MPASTNEGTRKMSIFKKLASYAQYHRTIRELSNLDANRLRDIGISRQDIRAIAARVASN
jgi:uncharacterized protein YjiS (DUF1127 family)